MITGRPLHLYVLNPQYKDSIKLVRCSSLIFATKPRTLGSDYESS